jgi:hypothetical protein
MYFYGDATSARRCDDRRRAGLRGSISACEKTRVNCVMLNRAWSALRRRLPSRRQQLKVALPRRHGKLQMRYRNMAILRGTWQGCGVQSAVMIIVFLAGQHVGKFPPSAQLLASQLTAMRQTAQSLMYNFHMLRIALLVLITAVNR